MPNFVQNGRRKSLQNTGIFLDRVCINLLEIFSIQIADFFILKLLGCCEYLFHRSGYDFSISSSRKATFILF